MLGTIRRGHTLIDQAKASLANFAVNSVSVIDEKILDDTPVSNVAM